MRDPGTLVDPPPYHVQVGADISRHLAFKWGLRSSVTVRVQREAHYRREIIPRVLSTMAKEMVESAFHGTPYEKSGILVVCWGDAQFKSKHGGSAFANLVRDALLENPRIRVVIVPEFHTTCMCKYCQDPVGRAHTDVAGLVLSRSGAWVHKNVRGWQRCKLCGREYDRDYLAAVAILMKVMSLLVDGAFPDFLRPLTAEKDKAVFITSITQSAKDLSVDVPQDLDTWSLRDLVEEATFLRQAVCAPAQLQRRQRVLERRDAWYGHLWRGEGLPSTKEKKILTDEEKRNKKLGRVAWNSPYGPLLRDKKEGVTIHSLLKVSQQRTQRRAVARREREETKQRKLVEALTAARGLPPVPVPVEGPPPGLQEV